jgi:tripartite-type tricarboxylate transporter receptor subunit TctC
MRSAIAINGILSGAAAIFCFACAAVDAAAQGAPAPASAVDAYPSKPVLIVVPFTPGTGMDILARQVGQKLGERWKQPVVVENRPGASGNIGTELVVKAPADGYTLLMSVNTLVMNASLYRNLPYDPVKDLAPVEKMAVGTLVATVNPAVPANTLEEFVTYARANPGKLAYGSPGVGTPQHLATELFKSTVGVEMLHVPYKGSSGAITGLISGDVVFMFNALHAVLPQIKAGKLKALAVGGAARAPTAPDVPTVAESGYPDFDVDLWYGLLAPAATPKAIIAKLNRDISEVITTPQMRATLAGQGLEVVTSTPEAFGSLVKTDLARWSKVVTAAKITAE